MPTVFSDTLHRIAYSTDASAYREMPLGVAYPDSVEDIQSLLSIARSRKTHLIPRAAGTSIAGQVVLPPTNIGWHGCNCSSSY